METAKINRINELAKKKKESSLTPEETAEQAALREEYLREFRAQFQSQLDHTVIRNPDGSEIRLSERRKKKDDEGKIR